MWGGSWQLQIAYGGNSGEAHTWYREDGKRWHYKVRGCGVNTNVYSIINYNGMLINIWKIDAFGAKGKREMRCWMIEVKYLCVWNPVLKPVEQHSVDSEWSLHPQLHLGYLFTYIKYLLQKLLLLGVKKIMLGPVASEKKDVWSRISLPRNAVVVQKVPRYVCVVQHWEEGTTLLEHRRKSFRGKANKQTTTKRPYFVQVLWASSYPTFLLCFSSLLTCRNSVGIGFKFLLRMQSGFFNLLSWFQRECPECLSMPVSPERASGLCARSSLP